MRVLVARGFLGAVVVGALLFAASAVYAKEVPSPWKWTDYGPSLRDVSCASPGVCVAVGQRAVSLHSKEDSDVSLAWSKGFLSFPDELTGVTCNRAFCLAVSNTRTATANFASKVYRSTDHGAKWSEGVELGEAGPAKTRSAVAIACGPAVGRSPRGTAGACYAVGPAGGIWRSTDEGLKWEPLDVPSTPESYARVACPAADACVAVGGDDVGSSAVIRGKKVTSVKLPKKAGGMLGLACDTTTRCTATDTLGHYMSLSIPDEQWGPVKDFPYPLGTTQTPVSALACPMHDVCVGVERGEPEVMTTASLSTDAWESRAVATKNLDAIACANTTCIAAGKSAAWFASDNSGDDWARVNEVAPFDAIQCSAALEPTCVAGGKEDLGVTGSEGELWTLPIHGRTGLDMKAVNCTGPSECLLLGKSLSLFTADMNTFFTRQSTTTHPAGTDALTCITDQVCVGLSAGVVYTTLDGAQTPWTQNGFVPEIPSAVACLRGRTNPATCVATAGKHIVLGTMTQSAGRISWSWKYAHLNAPAEGLLGVGCSPGGACTAAGTRGEVFTSDGTDLTHWKKHTVPEGVPVDNLPKLSAVACPADGVCLVGGDHGDNAVIASTENDWKDFSYEQFEGIEIPGEHVITGFGCKSASHCVAVGSTAFVGTVERPRRHRRG